MADRNFQTLEFTNRPPKLDHHLNRILFFQELFKPRDASCVRWYNCGPTVYDVSHMGHARCYISFDIIRRVLQQYFKYPVKFVQNITDIDDKIIKRARQNHLWAVFVAGYQQQRASLAGEFAEAKQHYRAKIGKEEDPAKKAMLERQLQEAEQVTDLADLEQFADKAKNVFIEYLDKTRGESVTDNLIFTELPRQFEDDYYVDMQALNVLRPDHAPRVSDYIEQIVAFIQRIIENGFAYATKSGSVYFNTVAFNNHSLHKYGKLAPEAIGDQNALNEGEGDLSLSDRQLSEKLNKNDFALWKASKPGEPAWPSPFGAGRPGWHIECSTMACDVLGEYADLHSGGIDLRFPHHENEIAQTESYYNTGKNWIDCFLHTGHLHIEGCKMSKSLKNFISIKQALQANSSRQIRLAFLLHSWEDSLDYSRKTMQEALAYEKTFKEFFFLVEDLLDNRQTAGDHEWSQAETELDADLAKYARTVDECLCDNINTKGSVMALASLVSSANVYVKEKGANRVEISLLRQIAVFITDLLKVFGVIEGEPEIGFGSGASLSDAESKSELILSYVRALGEFAERVAGHAKETNCTELTALCDELTSRTLPSLGVRIVDSPGSPRTFKLDPQLATSQTKKAVIMPYVKVLAEFREKVREQARQSRLKPVLALCDELRDQTLPIMGVKIDDKEVDGQSTTLVKIDEDQLAKDLQTLRIEQEALRAAKEAERLEKERKKAEAVAAQAARDELKRLPASELFRRETDKYRDFDEKGFPLTDASGEPLSKKLIGKLTKLYQAQEKKHAEYLKSIETK